MSWLDSKNFTCHTLNKYIQTNPMGFHESCEQLRARQQMHPCSYLIAESSTRSNAQQYMDGVHTYWERFGGGGSTKSCYPNLEVDEHALLNRQLQEYQRQISVTTTQKDQQVDAIMDEGCLVRKARSRSDPNATSSLSTFEEPQLTNAIVDHDIAIIPRVNNSCLPSSRHINPSENKGLEGTQPQTRGTHGLSGILASIINYAVLFVTRCCR